MKGICFLIFFYSLYSLYSLCCYNPALPSPFVNNIANLIFFFFVVHLLMSMYIGLVVECFSSVSWPAQSNSFFLLTPLFFGIPVSKLQVQILLPHPVSFKLSLTIIFVSLLFLCINFYYQHCTSIALQMLRYTVHITHTFH